MTVYELTGSFSLPWKAGRVFFLKDILEWEIGRGCFPSAFGASGGKKKKSYKPLRARKKCLLQRLGYKTHVWIELCCQYSSLAAGATWIIAEVVFLCLRAVVTAVIVVF